MSRNWLEWVVLVVSAALLVGVVGFLVVDGLRDEGTPPRPVATLDFDGAHDGEGAGCCRRPFATRATRPPRR